ncbi:MAG: PLDc N-terminal domain-containing protein, partial [Synergistaceae bacterium]|nr:PLDc N-terminal domain-containing protein [Synergistaceae bacterium]
MKKNRSLGEKSLAIGVSAFILGLLPYLLSAVLSDIGDANYILYAKKILEDSWALTREYLPVIAAIYVACAAVLIFLEGQNPDRTILWLLTLALLPVIGIILYMLLGPDMKRVKMRKFFKPTKSYPSMGNLEWERSVERVRKISTLAFRNSSAEICERCEVGILINGEQTFHRIKSELARA